MSHLKQVTPTLSPLPYAQESMAAGQAASATATAKTPEPQPPSLENGWWKVPAIPDASYPGPSAPFRSEQEGSAGSGKTWTRGGEIMTAIGIALAGSGAVALVAGSEENEIADSGVAINWKATEAIWLSAGAVLTLIGVTQRR